MNNVDLNWLKQYEEIKENGFNDKDSGYEVRPKWEDGEAAHTIGVFNTTTEYDLSKEFPISSLRNQYWKTAINELLWIYRDCSNNVNDLKGNIWDSWADETGSIGKAYGYQIGKIRKWDDVPFECNQIDRVIHLLRTNPNNRRIFMTLLNQDDVTEMGLQPCAHSIFFNVQHGKLNAHLVQRSGDFLAAAGAGGFNEIQYATLILMLAQLSGYEPGRFVHTTTNMHIYDRHFAYCTELYNLKENKDLDNSKPKLIINPEVKELKDFVIEDFNLEGYNPISKSKRMEIAI